MTDTFANVQPGETLVLQIGNGATPEVFSASCTINTTRSLTFSSKSSTAEVPDCTNPSNPAYTQRLVQSTDFSFDGAGLADGPSLLGMIQWQQSGAPKNCKVILNRSGANGGFTVSVPLICDSIEAGGGRAEEMTFTGKFSQYSAPTSIVANP